MASTEAKCFYSLRRVWSTMLEEEDVATWG